MSKLRYSFNAICALEEDTGTDIATYINANFGPNSSERPKFSPLRKIYQVGLLENEPNLTLEAAGTRLQYELSNGKTLDNIINEIFDAVTKAMPQIESGNSNSAENP